MTKIHFDKNVKGQKFRIFPTACNLVVQIKAPVITTHCFESTYLNVCQSLVMMKTSVRTISDDDHVEDNDNDHDNDFETFS